MWIESHQSIRSHPKIKKAARLANVSEPEMIGRLHYLWWWAIDYAPDGDVTRYSQDDIEMAVDWNGTPGAFYNALLNCGFNDHSGFLESDGQRIVIHDWHQYGGKLLERRTEDAERKRQARRKISDGHPEDSAETAHVDNKQTIQTIQTEQEITEQTEQTDPGAGKPRTSKQSAHDESINTLVKVFSEWTSIPCPNGSSPKGTLATRWYAPLNRILSLCGKDTTKSAQLIKDAIDKMRQDKLTISAPQSIENVAISIYGSGHAYKSRNQSIADDWKRALNK